MLSLQEKLESDKPQVLSAGCAVRKPCQIIGQSVSYGSHFDAYTRQLREEIFSHHFPSTLYLMHKSIIFMNLPDYGFYS